MFSPITSINEANTNCIKLCHKWPLRRKEFNQYNSYGNIIFTYRGSYEIIGIEKFVVYDSNERKIGSIEKKLAFNQILYTLYDEYDNIINYIGHNSGASSCSAFTHIFYDANRNIENILILKRSCCSLV